MQTLIGLAVLLFTMFIGLILVYGSPVHKWIGIPGPTGGIAGAIQGYTGQAPAAAAE